MTDLLEETGETGDERADAALGGLTRLGALPVSAHADVFEEVFTGLEQALAAVNGATARESAVADDIPGRVTASPDDASGRSIAPAHGTPGRETASPHDVPGQGDDSVDGPWDRRP
ncbi:hypothetical protein GCM10022252_53550 [Streptosporangium oxazolinicum]|uniref:Uncharacterized protein n=1 Tax=Streptosporangium oxazolinicum TaxID=909287 RepID=A0ABP8B832_9ACTN